MEDKLQLHLLNLEEPEEDALSLCDLPIHDQDPETETEPGYQNSPARPDLFEFSTNAKPGTNPSTDRILFCGRVIHRRDPLPGGVQPKWRSESFNNSQTFHSARLSSPGRSSSFRAPAAGSYRYQSSGSRKHKVLIGLTKIQPMDLSEIRKRQGRRTPAPIVPVPDEPVIASGGKSHWGLLRPLRCKSHLARVLAIASFGCFPLM
ncbi:uncharacterized protein LOC132188317 [Corylus avellana]|uniref:uncharacterized protein LOC132188317 n=1 Tax=Corylus avellana TaxID=13451 RepID=UPI00286C9487|nr:uncharacterized protein LOC132188317 [Corylus avellana]